MSDVRRKSRCSGVREGGYSVAMVCRYVVKGVTYLGSIAIPGEMGEKLRWPQFENIYTVG